MNDGSIGEAEADIDLGFDGPGYYWHNVQDDGVIDTGGVVRYQKIGAGGSTGKLFGSTTKPFTVVGRVTGLRAGQFTVRVFRNVEASTDIKIQNTYFVSELKSYKIGEPVKMDKKHTFVEIHGLASEKLAGNIQTANMVGHRVIRDIDATGWLTDTRTSNPALIALDILTCEENPQPLKDTQIDFASFKRLRDICEGTPLFGSGHRYTYNGILRDSSTVKEQVSRVLSNGRAQLTIKENGKIGVLIDETGRTPRQMITPANSWDFSGSRNFPIYPDALRVTYTEPNAEYTSAEVIVYDDGKNDTNAEHYEDMPTAGITNRQEAWRYGRYMMAQSKMRNETFTVSLDIEHLAVQRGDIVTVQHDVPKFGGAAARVQSVAGNDVFIDQLVDGAHAAGALGARMRLADGTIVTKRVTSAFKDKVTLADPVPGLDYGDLIVIGDLGRETKDYIVLSIEPDVNMAAQLTLVPYVEGVYTADTGTIPDWKPDFGSGLIGGATDLEIAELSHIYEITYEAKRPIGEISVKWKTNGNLVGLDHYNVIRTMPDGSETVVATTKDPFYNEKVDLLLHPELWNKDIKYTIEPVDFLGQSGKTGTEVVLVLPDTTPPRAVEGFAVNVTNNTSIDLFWRLSDEPDIDFYDLRYTPQTAHPTWGLGLSLAKISSTINRTTVGARTGTYMIVAVDTSGNRSTPVMLRTSVEKLPDLDIVKVVDDAPLNWPGVRNDMVKYHKGLRIDGAFGNVKKLGVYNFDGVFDATYVQELRVQAKITAYGLSSDDIMAKWVPLATAIPLARADADDWDCWLEVRTAANLDVMAGWTPLRTAIPLAGAGVHWQPWRRVESADLTGRLFQFRLIAISRSPDINVHIASAAVEIDVLERVTSFPDNTITDADAGLLVPFTPAFKDPPTIAVTIDGNDFDVISEVTGKTATEVRVRLVDVTSSTPGAPHYVTGKFDLVAAGWGRQRLNPL